MLFLNHMKSNRIYRSPAVENLVEFRAKSEGDMNINNMESLRRKRQKQQKVQSNEKQEFNIKILQSSISVLILALILGGDRLCCESREIDWSALSQSIGANNLRILVGPQRRMTKGYEFEYTNGSQPVTGETTTYVIPGSGGSYQTVGQLSPSSQPVAPSAAYSALSASLANLKSRLSARGVTLGGPISEGNPTHSTSSLYSSPGANYGSSIVSDNTQQQQTSSQGQTYLTVGSPSSSISATSSSSSSSSPTQRDHQSTNGYTISHNQNTDNKTIVLAIPAKINFVPDARSKLHQHQQMTLIQPSSDQQQIPPAYSNKQISLISGQETGGEQTTQLVARDPNSDQEQQYVILNSPGQPSTDNSAQLMTSSLGGANGYPQQVSSMFSGVYPTIHQNSMSGAEKHLTSYQQSQPITKIYTTGEQGTIYESPQLTSAVKEPQTMISPSARYISCPDTCNPNDPRWRKQMSKFKQCCPGRSMNYDSAEQTPERLNDKLGDDSHSYLQRNRLRSRRSRRPLRQNRYYSTQSSNGEEDPPTEGPAIRGSSSTNSRYAKNRQYLSSSPDAQDSGSYSSEGSTATSNGKYESTKDRSARRGRSRDLDSTSESQGFQESNEDDTNGYYPQPYDHTARSIAGYGSGSYSVSNGEHSGPYVNTGSSSVNAHNVGEEEDSRQNYEDQMNGDDQEYPNEQPPGVSDVSSEGETETEASNGYNNNNRYSQTTNKRNRKYNPKNRTRKMSTQYAKEPKSSGGSIVSSNNNNKRGRGKGKQGGNIKPQEYQPTNYVHNSTDHDAVSAGDQHHNPDQANSGDEDQTSYSNQKDPSNYHSNSSMIGSSIFKDVEKEAISLANKYKSNLNDSTVASLSKTTMHLKEILSLLEKKAHMRVNETSPPQQQPIVLTTTTPAPIPTTTMYTFPPFGSAYSSPLLSSDFLGSPELSLPRGSHRFESSSLLGPSSLPLPPYGSLSSDPYSSLPSFSSSPLSSKPYSIPNSNAQRKRRVPKTNIRPYNMMSKPHNFGMSSPFLPSSVAKNALLNAYYPSFYPYLYARGNSASITSSYPYKNLKNSYLPLLNGPISSKLASSSMYSDESRLHHLSSLDPIAGVASSLRPSTTMRLKTKPFVYSPSVLPIYNRHTILDVKK